MRFAVTSIAAATLLMLAMTACDSSPKTTEPPPPAPAVTTTPVPPASTSATPPTSSAPVFTTTVTQSPNGLTVEDTASVEVTATVKAVNQATREVTLEGASGRSVRFIAGKDIRRLDEVRVGDRVRVEYLVSLLAELRPPTPEESASPLAIVEVAGRAPQGATPVAGAIGATRMVTTVEAIDIPNMRIVLRGPLGDLTTVKARNPDNIRKLRVGDTIVLFLTEGVGVSLVKT